MRWIRERVTSRFRSRALSSSRSNRLAHARVCKKAGPARTGLAGRRRPAPPHGGASTFPRPMGTGATGSGSRGRQFAAASPRAFRGAKLAVYRRGQRPPQGGRTMAHQQNIAEWHGKTLVDRDGQKIGKLQDVYVDVETDEPMFGTVKEGLIGRHLTFVPLAGRRFGPDALQMAVTREQVKSARNIELHGDER